MKKAFFQLLFSILFLAPVSCISVNTASRTLDSGTVYRTWLLDEHSEAYLKNGLVFIKVRQCDQHKNTPVIGSPLSQIGDGSRMEDIPGTEKTVFLQSPWKEEQAHPLSISPRSFMASAETAVAKRFIPAGSRPIRIRRPEPTIKGMPSVYTAREVIHAPSTGRKILAGIQSCLIDVPGTVVASVIAIPVGIIVTPCLGLYNLCT